MTAQLYSLPSGVGNRVDIKGEERMFKKMLMTAAVSAIVAAFAAGAALAGEATGNFGTTGKQTPIGAAPENAPHAASICSFSGQNPERFLDPSDPNSGFEPGRTQSWGQIPKADRDFLRTVGAAPGQSCNGHTGFFAGGGSE